MPLQPPIQEIQKQIIAEFADLTSWEGKYKKIIQTGKELESFPEEFRLEKNMVSGCQSQVWLHAILDEGKVKLYADSDAMIVKGLIALLLKLFSNQAPEDILVTNADFITEIGMDKHLSMNRSNGLAAMVKQIKLYALVFKSLNSANN